VKLIWYVDDSPEQRTSLQTELEAKLPGCAVRTFPDGESILGTMEDSETLPFCIIADELMEGISGFGLYQMLTERTYSIPFIIISSDETAIHRFAATGVIALPKPDGRKYKRQDFISRLGSLMDVIEIRKEIHENITPLKDDMREIKEWIRETRNVDVLTKISNFVDQCAKQPFLKWVIVPLLLLLISVVGGAIKAAGWVK